MNAKVLSVEEAAEVLSVSTVRIHGLLRDAKLFEASSPILRKGRYVKGITMESIESYKNARNTRYETIASNKLAKASKTPKTRKNTKQFVLTLTSSQYEELRKQGFSLRPRFEKKEVMTTNETHSEEISG